MIEIVEDADGFRGFEAAVIADYDARTAVEREPVLRLASLLWRLRRTTAIETDLIRIQAEILRDSQHRCESPDQSEQRQNVLYRAPTLRFWCGLRHKPHYPGHAKRTHHAAALTIGRLALGHVWRFNAYIARFQS